MEPETEHKEEVDIWITDMKGGRREDGLPSSDRGQSREDAATSRRKEADSVELESIAMHREVLMKDAAVKPVKGRKKRYRGQHLAAERRREPKELTQGDCGSWRKLAATCRKVSRCAAVAWCK
jgi:hypothetical protein